jgi:hypothetical protein
MLNEADEIVGGIWREIGLVEDYLSLNKGVPL